MRKGIRGLYRDITHICTRIACFLLVIFLGGGVLLPVRTAYAASHIAPTSLEDYIEVLERFGGRYPYANYIQDHAGLPRPDAVYFIEASDYIGVPLETFVDFDGMPGISVLAAEDGFIEWEVDVVEAGLYNIALHFYNFPGRSSDIQRALFINGELPFLEAGAIELPRTWVNETDEFLVDNQGNQIRPRQIESHTWQEVVINSPNNGFSQPLYFYLNAGVNRIALVSVREPMLIRSITVFQSGEALPYSYVAADFAGLAPAIGDTIHIQGQLANRKSSPMLFPIADRSSPAPTPYSARRVMLNTIGGGAWGIPGQWIEWDFYVEEPGLYNMGMSVKQNFIDSAHVYRSITINGQHPFREMEAVPFGFSNSWRVETLGGDEPYLFYFTQGWHTIRMEVTMGAYGDYMREIQESLLRLSELYRQIVMITGTSPDMFRDYQVARRLPHLGDALRAEREVMDRVHGGLTAISGQAVPRDAVIRSMSEHLTRMYENVDDVPQHLNRMQSSIGSLGTWVMSVREQPLALDAIYLIPAGNATPRISNGIFARILHEIRSLFFSFFIDFSAIGNVTDDNDARTITVWVGSRMAGMTDFTQAGASGTAGRDQANVIKSLIDSDFTPNTGINVNLMLVQMETLLPATLSRQGPDVALMVDADVPMNFAMRGAVADLAVFPDFEEVAARFSPEALVPYSFRDYTFALPITQTFSMMFYRRDILAELELTPPGTWDDVRTTLPVLSENHMTFGLPAFNMHIVANTFAMMLYQAGGRFYADDGAYSELDTNTSVSVFREFTQFFTDYRLPQAYDFANRFRTGQMPIAIADYSMFNTLQVFAPEIHGLWGFTLVPGTMQADGSVNHASIMGGTAGVIMELAEDKDAAWEFLSWFTSASVQTDFGRGLESLMGSAARYPTANEEAFMQLPWSNQDFNRLMAQYEYVRGIPQVPGGYFTNRQIQNAFFAVVTGERIGPRAALTDRVRYINDEIRHKRQEFGLE